MKSSRALRRELFLKQMSENAVACYRDPYGRWEEDEKQYMPKFLSLVGTRRIILDLAGGYAKAVRELQHDGNLVVLADMSSESLGAGRKEHANGEAQFIRLNMLKEFPFADSAFDGIWFAEAFEYVPPDKRGTFLNALRRIVKEGGIVFLNGEGLSDELSLFSYLKNYLYWKVVKRAPVIWGEYIYMLDLPLYKGWHYHSLILSRRIEKVLRTAGFEILDRKDSGEGDYRTYLLRAS